MLSKEIIEGCINGAIKAQRELYTYCYPMLYKIALRYTHDDFEAVEVVTDAYLKILKNVSQFNEHVAIDAWIRRIGINTAIDKIRANKKYKDAVRFNASESYDAFENIYVDTSNAQHDLEAEAIVDMLKTLPDFTKEILNLFAIDGYSHKEISELLQITEELSRWHVFKGRKLMQEKTNEYKGLKTKII